MKEIKNILIVGGGTAAYISALILNQRFHKSVKIDIVKSNKIGIIGVGEGSTEHWEEFIKYTGIDYKEIIKECDVTCKVGIMFQNWSDNDFLHSISDLNKFKFSQTFSGYLKLITDKCNLKELNNPLYWENKVQIDCIKNNFSPSRQYHFNTFKLNDFLNKKCLQRNINIYEDEINDIQINSEGDIKNLTGENKSYSYDFYIDCTGFKKLLISKLGAKWNSYSKYLKLKEAIVFPTEDTEEYNIYTTAKALDYGWMFSIPTYGRQGNGYIFDSTYINADKAKEEVEKLLDKKIEIVRHIKFDPGALDKVWINNCVAIGLSANFVEPLEASSIATSIQQAFLLNHYLPIYDKVQINEYNDIINSIMDNIKDFIFLHYLTNKNNTNFWKDIKTLDIPHTLKNNLDKWQLRLPIAEDFNVYKTKYILFNEENFINILYGLNLLNIENLKKYFFSLNENYINLLNTDIVNFKKNEYSMFNQCIGHKEYLNFIRNSNE